MRRSLVLTDESRRHPFRASLPRHVFETDSFDSYARASEAAESGVGADRNKRSSWRLDLADARQFLLAYGAFFFAASLYIV